MTSLKDLGFREGIIAETIVSTCDSNRKPNAAPMGIEIKNPNQLIIRPYVSSLTYKNIQTTKSAVVNLTFDPSLFYVTAFKEANPNGKLSEDLFEKAKTVSAPRLKNANAFVEVIVNEKRSFCEDRAEFLCKTQHIELKKMLPEVYCRAQFATIEAIVHATRIELFLNGTENQQKHAKKLLELIDVCQDVVNRTASNSIYFDIMSNLTKRIDSWRNPK